jgi:mono/diheme cytochrome c family protein
MRSLVVLMLTIAILSWASPLTAADAKAGKEVFAKRCATCHGTAGEGKETLAKTLKVEIKHLGSKEAQSKSDADLHKIILEGTGKMKGVKDVDAKSADDVVAYLRTLKK